MNTKKEEEIDTTTWRAKQAKLKGTDIVLKLKWREREEMFL